MNGLVMETLWSTRFTENTLYTMSRKHDRLWLQSFANNSSHPFRDMANANYLADVRDISRQSILWELELF